MKQIIGLYAEYRQPREQAIISGLIKMIMYKAILLAAMIPLLSFTCNKKLMEDKCYEVRVIRTTCASLVVQVLNDDRKGEDGWKDIMDNNRKYDNLFNIVNRCELSEALRVNDTLKVCKSKKETNECVSCMLYDAPPYWSVAVERCGEE